MDNIGEVTRLRISKGNKKDEAHLEEILCLENIGVQGDVNAKGGSRQVTLMDEALKEWELSQDELGICLIRFKANITIKGIDFSSLHSGSMLQVGEAILEISDISKKCYSDVCKIYNPEEDCSISYSCLFAKVKKSGSVRLGDKGVKTHLLNQQ